MTGPATYAVAPFRGDGVQGPYPLPQGSGSFEGSGFAIRGVDRVCLAGYYAG
jgi:hypothetical protein